MDGPLISALVALLFLIVFTSFAFASRVCKVFGSNRARQIFRKGNAHFLLLAERPEQLFAIFRLGQQLSFVGLLLVGIHISPEEFWIIAPLIILLGATIEGAWRVLLSANPSERWCRVSLKIFAPWIALMRPLIVRSDRFWSRFMKEEEESMTESISAVLDALLETPEDPEQQRNLRWDIAFGSARAVEVMIPRNEIVSCDVNDPEALKLKHLIQFSRLPIYEETPDNIIGVLYAKDALLHLSTQQEGFSEFDKIPMRSPFFIPESRELKLLFEDLRDGEQHMAIVVNEFGGVSGIVTIEDLIERFFGDIRDEFDLAKVKRMSLVGDHHIIASARLDILQFAEIFSLEFPENRDYETLGGLIINLCGCVPPVGEEIEAMGLHFVILKADARHVIQVEVRLSSS